MGGIVEKERKYEKDRIQKKREICIWRCGMDRFLSEHKTAGFAGAPLKRNN